MNTEQHVTSLEISKRLKELGVKQESMFMWDYDGKLRVGIVQAISPHQKTAYPDSLEISAPDCYSAFLASELGELLELDKTDWLTCSQDPVSKLWVVDYRTGIVKADTEADCRGKMLIYLLENDLLST